MFTLGAQVVAIDVRIGVRIIVGVGVGIGVGVRTAVLLGSPFLVYSSCTARRHFNQADFEFERPVVTEKSVLAMDRLATTQGHGDN